MAGLLHSTFMDITGCHIYTCGQRSDCGQLGIEDELQAAKDLRDRMQPQPYHINDPDKELEITQIVSGDNSCFAVARTGKFYLWGFGDSGQHGHGKNADQLPAMSVMNMQK